MGVSAAHHLGVPIIRTIHPTACQYALGGDGGWDLVHLEKKSVSKPFATPKALNP